MVRPAGGLGCQGSFGEDQEAVGDVSTVLEQGDDLSPGQPYSFSDSAVPDPGGDVICAWLENTDSDDPSDPSLPSATVVGPITLSFNSAAPQVGRISVSVPAKIVAGQGYQIRYATQTDQDEDLASTVIAAGGDGCADSYEDQTDSDADFNDVFGGDSDVYGSATTIGSDEEDDPGAYVICSWIEDPNTDLVYASAATPIKVVASASDGSTASSSARSGSGATPAAGACVVPRYAGATLSTVKRRLTAAGCAVGTVHYHRSTSGASGRVVALSATPGRRLAHGAAVSVTVARR